MQYECWQVNMAQINFLDSDDIAKNTKNQTKQEVVMQSAMDRAVYKNISILFFRHRKILLNSLKPI